MASKRNQKCYDSFVYSSAWENTKIFGMKKKPQNLVDWLGQQSQWKILTKKMLACQHGAALKTIDGFPVSSNDSKVIKSDRKKMHLHHRTRLWLVQNCLIWSFTYSEQGIQYSRASHRGTRKDLVIYVVVKTIGVSFFLSECIPKRNK